MKLIYKLIVLFAITCDAQASNSLGDKIRASIIEGLIAKEVLLNSDDPENITIHIDQKIALNNITGEGVEVKGIYFNELNKKSRKFKVRLTVNQNTHEKEYNFTGNYEELIEVPVLKRKTSRNDIISIDDIYILKIPLSKLTDDIILDQSAIIGKTVLRTIYPNQPLSSKTITSPYVVNKNDVVTITYQNKAVSIKTVAIAVDSGAIGDMIRVKNPRSNNIVNAIVKGKNLVTIPVTQ